MLSIAVQFEELNITRTASITDEKLGVVMTMKIDAAEVAKVFSDLKLPAAFKAYEQQLGDPGAMKLDFGDVDFATGLGSNQSRYLGAAQVLCSSDLNVS